MPRFTRPLLFLCFGVAVLAAPLLLVPGGTLKARAAGAEAERVDRLARAAARADDETTRIAAVVNLGRIGDSRALRPLLGALSDDSSAVRAVAAAALGELGYPAALPALHRAAEDERELVRQRAQNSIEALEAEIGAAQRTSRVLPEGEERAGERPRLHVLVQGVSDQTGAGSDAQKRQRSATVRRAIEEALASDPDVVVTPEAGAELGLAPHTLDVAIAEVDREARGDRIFIKSRLRVAITDHRGRMMSFVTGRARVEVPRAQFDRADLEGHRREAMESAARSLRRDVSSYLAREVASH